MSLSQSERSRRYRERHPDRVKASGQAWKEKQPKGWHRRTMLKTKYGMTLEQFDQMWIDQGGACAICRTPMDLTNSARGDGRECHIDHDHSKNVVRGLLCGRCNRGLGQFLDDPLRLRLAAEYIENQA